MIEWLADTGMQIWAWMQDLTTDLELTLGGWLLVITILLDIGIAIAIGIVRNRRERLRRREAWVKSFMRVAFRSASVGEVVRVIQRDGDSFLNYFMELADSMTLPVEQRDKVRDALIKAHQFPVLIRQLRGSNPRKRTRAAIWLGFAAPTQSTGPLVLALEKESKPSVRIHIIHSLVRLGAHVAIPSIVDTFAGSDPDYQRRVRGMLFEFGQDFLDLFDLLASRDTPEIQRLMAHVAARRGDQAGREYLERLVAVADADVALQAVELLLGRFIHLTDIDTLLSNEDELIVNLTLEGLGRIRNEASLNRLIAATQAPTRRKSAVLGLIQLVRETPRMYARLLEAMQRSESEEQTDALLEVAAVRVEYLIERWLRNRDSELEAVIVQLLESGRTSGIIGFLNRNHDPATEATVVAAIRPVVTGSAGLIEEFSLYAAESVLDRLDLNRTTVEQRRGERIGEAIRPLIVIGIIIVTVVAPVVVWGVLRFLQTAELPSFAWVAEYINSFEIFFGGYAFVLNMVYFGLLFFAAIAVVRQENSLRIKPLKMLFHEGMLPSISIIVPAYREEATIVQNVNSLMNLRYPDFEVIVVNDGSPDNTIPRLIQAFELERSDVFVHGYIGTQPIRAIYRNPRIPELLVIDKQNGGKADSLNAGINASRKDYFAAIDSDSLLERDSLLRLAGLFLDSDVPVVASGGNIFPVNGCVVDRGSLEEIHLPRELLGKFQTLEYIRSFMAGRTGWAQIRSLMIISGAFGLFRKRDVVDAHGYLTGRGHYKKDTVAEDMELVVRVTRLLRDRGQPFSVQYSFSANCWTEVPVTHKILRSQRDRWQRGLIDTMSIHSRMLLNPTHGSIGMVGFPYFFFFELLGPFIEVQGLAFLVTALIAGTLPIGIFAGVFAATIPMGIAVSLASLLLAEYHQHYFTRRDRRRLLYVSFIENFGYRQYASLIRLRGYLSVLSGKSGWGTMVRTGFAAGKK